MNLEFYYCQKGRDVLSNQKHFHDGDIEIIQFVSGKGTLIIGDKINRFVPGDTYIFDGSTLHCVVPEKEEEYVRNKLILDKNSIMQIMEESIEFKNTFFAANSESAKNLRLLFRRANNEITQNNNAKMILLSEAMKILHYCLKTSGQELEDYGGTISETVRYINANLSSPLTIDSIAEQMHISKYYVCHRFKEETGMTIHAYIRSSRISLAQKLLSDFDRRISDIAATCGFDDITRFSKTFKAETGMTPSEYRKSLSNHGAPLIMGVKNRTYKSSK